MTRGNGCDNQASISIDSPYFTIDNDRLSTAAEGSRDGKGRD
ncbi:MAG: hypothetical protein QOH31_1019 [Verrucomicrobiota bacterium]|jgi:hypothetical protein